MIGQVIAYDISEVEEIEDELMLAMNNYALLHGLDLLVIAFTSMFENGSVFYGSGELKHIVAEAFPNQKQEKHSFQADILSRKTQIVPAISQALLNR